MISMNADSLRLCIESVRKAGLEAKAEELRIYRSKIFNMFDELLHVSPQFSGEFVFNWELQVGDDPAVGFRALAGAPAPLTGHRPAEHEAGEDSEPLMSARMRGLRAIQRITYFGQPVYFVNHSPLDIDSPLVIGIDGSVAELRDPMVAVVWVAITSYLSARNG